MQTNGSDEERLVEVLSRIDLFESVKSSTLRNLLRVCPTRVLADGEVLFEHGMPGSSLYIVIEGQLHVFRGARQIATVGANEYVGEMTLLEDGPRSASVRAAGTATLLEMSRATFEAYLRTDPEALGAMMRTVCRRMRGTLDDTQAEYQSVSMLVHDMLNMVNTMTGAAIVMDRFDAGDRDRKLLENILAAQQTLQGLIRKALRTAGGVAAPYVKQPAVLDALIGECLEQDVAFHADVQRVTVDVQVHAPVAPVVCNATDIRRVLANLVINAAQAMPPGGAIVISLRQEQDKTFLAVADNGPGIPDHIRPWIFQPHFTTKPTGNGLGLSSCRDIIERLHQGRLTCESTEGVGTTFTCELPTGVG